MIGIARENNQWITLDKTPILCTLLLRWGNMLSVSIQPGKWLVGRLPGCLICLICRFWLASPHPCATLPRPLRFAPCLADLGEKHRAACEQLVDQDARNLH